MNRPQSSRLTNGLLVAFVSAATSLSLAHAAEPNFADKSTRIYYVPFVVSLREPASIENIEAKALAEIRARRHSHLTQELAAIVQAALSKSPAQRDPWMKQVHVKMVLGDSTYFVDYSGNLYSPERKQTYVLEKTAFSELEILLEGHLGVYEVREVWRDQRAGVLPMPPQIDARTP